MTTILVINGKQEVLKLKHYEVKDIDKVTSKLRIKLKKNSAEIKEITLQGSKTGIHNLSTDMIPHQLILESLFLGLKDNKVRYKEEEFKVRIYRKFKCTVTLEHYDELQKTYNVLHKLEQEDSSATLSDISKNIESFELSDIFDAIEILDKQHENIDKNTDSKEETEEETESEKTALEDLDEIEKTEVEELEDYNKFGFSNSDDIVCNIDVLDRKRWEQLNGNSSDTGKTL